MKRPRLVTFDAYMGLLDIDASLTPVVTDTLGLPEDASRAFVQTWRAKQMERAAVSNSLEKKRTSFRAATAMGLDYVAARRGLAMDADTREALIMAWDSLAPWPEANAVVSGVKAKGYVTAILSNGDQDMLEAVANQFEAGFDYILSSETAGKYKPHPAVYRLPETELGIPLVDVVHVAGSPNDVLGAAAAGLPCIWSNRQHDLVLDPAYGATYEVPDLNGVLDHI